jgi:hypothetical protein
MGTALMTKDELWVFVAGLVDHRMAVLEERIALLEKQVALVAVQDRIDLRSSADRSKISEVIR